MISPRRQKNISVYIGVAGYLAMIISGDFLIGVWSKLIAELLRIAFYRETKAPDMADCPVLHLRFPHHHYPGGIQMIHILALYGSAALVAVLFTGIVFAFTGFEQ